MDGKTFHPGQANNFYIFPAIGLAIYATRPRRITDEMLHRRGRRRSADQVAPGRCATRACCSRARPNILETEVTTATRVAELMFDRRPGQVERPRDIRAWIEGQLYRPHY